MSKFKHGRAARFTPGEAHQIRMALLSDAQLAAQHEVSVDLIGRVRRGAAAAYGPLTREERGARVERERELSASAARDRQRPHHLDLAVCDPYLLASASRLTTVIAVPPTLADNECEHGRIRGDRTPACGCWPGERVGVRITPDPVPAPVPAPPVPVAAPVKVPIVVTVPDLPHGPVPDLVGGYRARRRAASRKARHHDRDPAAA